MFLKNLKRVTGTMMLEIMIFVMLFSMSIFIIHRVGRSYIENMHNISSSSTDNTKLRRDMCKLELQQKLVKRGMQDISYKENNGIYEIEYKDFTFKSYLKNNNWKVE